MGVLHPDYLLRQLTSRQLAEWMAYFAYQPFGQDYTDMMTAQLTSIVYNANKGKHAQALKPADFLPQKKREQTPTEMKNVLRSALAAAGVNRKDH